MNINAEGLFKILSKIDYSKQKDLILSFSECAGFKFKNNYGDLSILEDELNSLCENEEYITIKYISEHLRISKPTAQKILKDKDVKIVVVDGVEKVLKSDYLEFILKSKKMY